MCWYLTPVLCSDVWNQLPLVCVVVQDLLLFLLAMGLEEGVPNLHDLKEKDHQTLTLSVHAFSDLTYVSPIVFLYLLKECYIHGKMSHP